jgi:hypothetical protein
MKTMSLKTLRDMTEDQLAQERLDADEEIQRLRQYKANVQRVVDERATEETLSKLNLDNPTIAAALAQRIENVGAIESQEEVNGVG